MNPDHVKGRGIIPSGSRNREAAMDLNQALKNLNNIADELELIGLKHILPETPVNSNPVLKAREKTIPRALAAFYRRNGINPGRTLDLWGGAVLRALPAVLADKIARILASTIDAASLAAAEYFGTDPAPEAPVGLIHDNVTAPWPTGGNLDKQRRGYNSGMALVFYLQTAALAAAELRDLIAEAGHTKQSGTELPQAAPWRAPGLPTRLEKLYLALGPDPAPASDVAVKIDEQPSRIFNYYEKSPKWKAWVKRFITRDRQGLYSRKK